jgi:hypothetical protein
VNQKDRRFPTEFISFVALLPDLNSVRLQLYSRPSHSPLLGSLVQRQPSDSHIHIASIVCNPLGIHSNIGHVAYHTSYPPLLPFTQHISSILVANVSPLHPIITGNHVFITAARVLIHSDARHTNSPIAHRVRIPRTTSQTNMGRTQTSERRASPATDEPR